MRTTSLSFALAAAVAAIAAAPAASAGTPSGIYSIFKYCPYTNPAVAEYGSCVLNVTKSGTLVIGNTTMPIEKPITLQGGVVDLGPSPLYDAVGAPTLDSPPAKVPGGLLGIMNPAPDWPFALWQAFWNVVATANDVNATIEPVQTIQTNFGNALVPPTDGSDPTAARLAVRVRLDNPLLGGTCYIGSAQTPVVLNLQTGTTAPPAPNQPITGSPGNPHPIFSDPDNFIGYLQVDGVTFVDNTFAVPAAKGCGNVALGLPIITQLLDTLVSGAVNLKVGLPSASGKNTAIMAGDASLSSAQYVQASEQ